MHDGMSTFFIVTTSDFIGLDSKTAKKVEVQGAFCLFLQKKSIERSMTKREGEKTKRKKPERKRMKIICKLV